MFKLIARKESLLDVCKFPLWGGNACVLINMCSNPITLMSYKKYRHLLLIVNFPLLRKHLGYGPFPIQVNDLYLELALEKHHL